MKGESKQCGTERLLTGLGHAQSVTDRKVL